LVQSNKKFFRFFSFVFLLVLTNSWGLSSVAGSQVDMVIFSYNRPMQLYALLESVKFYCTGLGQIRVIYRADNVFDSGYEEVKKTFHDVFFIKQGTNPSQDFKPLTLEATFNSPNQHVIFAVDDIVVKDFCDFSDMINTMETMRARVDVYGVYLSMGTHFSECYSLQCTQKTPPFRKINKDFFSWRFSDGQHDWRYPNKVDMTLYCKKDIERDLRELCYENPNRLEGLWAGRASKVFNKCGLCFENAKVVNVPLNRVQQVWTNRSMNLLSVEELLELFNRGLKIDIRPLYKIQNKAVHMEYTPTFVGRDVYVVKVFGCCA
jgi:hypothetical protein